jgi:hypothetical protein
MKALLSLLLVAIAVNPCQSEAAKPPKAPFSISISAEKQAVEQGSLVSIKIRLTNTSNRRMNASASYYGGVDASYQQEVWNDAGNLAERYQAGQPQPVASLHGTVKLRTLRPGESWENVSAISPQYDMSRPGQYVIQFSRPISDNPKDGVVKSNKIAVTVAQ